MVKRSIIALTALLLALLVACTSPSPRRFPSTGPTAHSSLQWIVFGDYPYGEKQMRTLPDVVSQMNAEPQVQLVFHVGDIKGTGPCTDTYYKRVRRAFDGFEVPLIYTFGDNEWTDCIKPENGGFNPKERLSALRRIFIPSPGQTLGRPEPVISQADAGYPENVSFLRGPVSFGVFHAVGSGDGLVPWPGRESATPVQKAEQRSRSASAGGVVRRAFDAARAADSAAVVLVTQADMFPPGEEAPRLVRGYTDIVRTVAEEASRFGGEVYLFNGDSHSYANDRPLSAGSGWTSVYGVTPVHNLIRVTVDGDENVTSYLRISARGYSRPVISWRKVPLESDRESGAR